jgi:hypothetical protein
LNKPNASTIICRAVEGGKRFSILQQGGKLPDDFLDNILAALNLTIGQSILIGYCIVHSQYPSLAQSGLRILQSRLPFFTDLSEIPDDILQGLRSLCSSNRVSDIHYDDIILEAF